MPDADLFQIQPASLTPALLGESPLWHPLEQCLYYVDIPGCALLRLPQGEGGEGEGGAQPQRWALDAEPGCIAALAEGGLLMARRDGLWRFDPATGQQQRLAEPPYDPARQRFNDGKPDAQGRLWVGTIDDARAPDAALYCYANGRFQSMAAGITTSNGLGWSPDGTRLYWSDTKAHAIYTLPFDMTTGTVGECAVFAQFPTRAADQPLAHYGGRPDGAAVDVEGCYWVAMFEGQRLLRLSPSGEVLQQVDLPVRCPTMPAFGGADLRTLYITTAREKRSEAELAAQPWAGCVLKMRVAVPGLPANLARLGQPG